MPPGVYQDPSTGLWLNADGSLYIGSIAGGAIAGAVGGALAPGERAANPLSTTSPLSSYSGPSLVELIGALGVLTAITLLLPPRYGIWVPVITLLGYGAANSATVAKLLQPLANA